MSIRDVGSYIGHNRVTSTAQGSASGIWSLAAVERRRRAAAWPTLVAPNAPTSLAATAGNEQLSLSWTAPADAGTSAITGYVVEYTPSGGSAATVNTNSTSTSYTLTGLTNGTEYTVRVAAISAVGAGTYSATATGTPTAVAAFAVAAAYQGSSSALPEGNTSGNAYAISGDGTSAVPLSLVIGGNDNCANRVWVAVNQTGTLNWTVTSSSESGYDYGRLYKHSGPVNTTILNPNGSTPAGFTAISDARSGETSASGNVSVTAGEFLVLAYSKDDSSDSGSDTVTLSAYIS